MTTLRVDYLVKYSDEIETVFYKIKGQDPWFDARETATIVISSEGAELLLMTGTFRSAVFVADETAVDASENSIQKTDPREVAGITSQNERLW